MASPASTDRQHSLCWLACLHVSIRTSALYLSTATEQRLSRLGNVRNAPKRLDPSSGSSLLDAVQPTLYEPISVSTPVTPKKRHCSTPTCTTIPVAQSRAHAISVEVQLHSLESRSLRHPARCWRSPDRFSFAVSPLRRGRPPLSPHNPSLQHVCCRDDPRCHDESAAKSTACSRGGTRLYLIAVALRPRIYQDAHSGLQPQ